MAGKGGNESGKVDERYWELQEAKYSRHLAFQAIAEAALLAECRLPAVLCAVVLDLCWQPFLWDQTPAKRQVSLDMCEVPQRYWALVYASMPEEIDDQQQARLPEPLQRLHWYFSSDQARKDTRKRGATAITKEDVEHALRKDMGRVGLVPDQLDDRPGYKGAEPAWGCRVWIKSEKRLASVRKIDFQAHRALVVPSSAGPSRTCGRGDDETGWVGEDDLYWCPLTPLFAQAPTGKPRRQIGHGDLVCNLNSQRPGDIWLVWWRNGWWWQIPWSHVSRHAHQGQKDGAEPLVAVACPVFVGLCFEQFEQQLARATAVNVDQTLATLELVTVPLEVLAMFAGEKVFAKEEMVVPAVKQHPALSRFCQVDYPSRQVMDRQGLWRTVGRDISIEAWGTGLWSNPDRTSLLTGSRANSKGHVGCVFSRTFWDQRCKVVGGWGYPIRWAVKPAYPYHCPPLEKGTVTITSHQRTLGLDLASLLEFSST